MRVLMMTMILSLTGAALADTPLLQVDKEKKEVRLIAEVTKRTEVAGKTWPIEVMLCTRGGKMHETVFHTEAKGSALHRALTEIGLQPGQPAWPAEATEDGKYVEPKGDRVEIFVEWTSADGKTQREPSYRFLVSGPGESDARRGGARGELKEVTPFVWLFTGSATGLDPDTGTETYGADIFLSIATINHQDRTAVLQLPGGDVPGIIFETSALLPPPGTKVTLVFVPAQ